MFTHILFDMDGTLVDSLEFHAGSLQRFFEKQYQILLPRQRAVELVGLPLGDIFANIIPGQDGVKALQLLEDFYQTDVEDLIQQIQVIPRVHALLQQIHKRQKKACVASNSSHNLVKKILASQGLGPFERVYGARENNTDKTLHCAGYLKEAGCRLSQVLYVGDSAGDVEMARRLGIQSCLVLNAYSWIHKAPFDLAALQPDYVVDDIGEIEKLL